MNNNFISIKNLEIKIDGKIILSDVNFDVKKGEIISIIGENGAGKTTLLKAILGNIEPTNGTIEIFTDKISYVPQKLNIDNTLPITSFDFIKMFNPNLSKKEIIQILDDFGISWLADRKISNISSGELQKVLIVNAFAKNPDLILMDEPTANIDKQAEESFYKMILDITRRKNDITFVIVSHNIDLVYAYSTKIISLHKSCCCIEFVENSVVDEMLIPHTHKHDHNHDE